MSKSSMNVPRYLVMQVKSKSGTTIDIMRRGKPPYADGKKKREMLHLKVSNKLVTTS